MSHTDESLANANLIEAAPEMLDALKAALNFVIQCAQSDEDSQLVSRLENIIKKAKGEL